MNASQGRYDKVLEILREFPDIQFDPFSPEGEDNSAKISGLEMYLSDMARAGSLPTLQEAVKLFPRINLSAPMFNCADDLSEHLIVTAARYGHLDFMIWLLQQGVEVSDQYQPGQPDYLTVLGEYSSGLIDSMQLDKLRELLMAFPRMSLTCRHIEAPSISESVLNHARQDDFKKTRDCLHLISEKSEHKIADSRLVTIKVLLDFAEKYIALETHDEAFSSVLSAIATHDLMYGRDNGPPEIASIKMLQWLIAAMAKEEKNEKMLLQFQNWQALLSELQSHFNMDQFLNVCYQVGSLVESDSWFYSVKTKEMERDIIAQMRMWLPIPESSLPQQQLPCKAQNSARLFKRKPVMDYEDRQSLPIFIF